MSQSKSPEMGEEARPTRVAQLEEAKRALARAAFTLCWLPSVALALLYWGRGEGSPPLALFILLSLWYLNEYLIDGKYREYISIFLSIAILSGPVWHGSSHVHLWYAVTLAGIATEILSALYAPWPFALIFIFVTALIEHFVLISKTFSPFSPGVSSLENWIASLWLFILGSFIGFAYHRLQATVSREDRISESMETLKARDAVARAISDEHASQQRRLHETVLNTLTTLVRKGGGSPAQLMSRLSNEITEARAFEGIEAPSGMSAIVDSVIAAVGVTELRIQVRESEDISLSQIVGRDVRDALAELIRNAIKHSKGTEVAISWRVNRRFLEITIADDGIGVSDKAAKGLGLGQILPEIVRDRRAKMVISSNYGQGARFELSVPLDVEVDPPDVDGVPYSILQEFDSVGRLLLAAPALSVAVLGWWLISPYQPKLILAGLLLLHVALVLTASINPRARSAWLLIAAGLLVGLVIIFLISINLQDCADISQLRWAANFLYGSTSLGLAFYSPGRFRPFLIVVSVLALFMMSLLLPSACASALFTPALALFGIFLVIVTIWRQSNRWRASVRLSEIRNAELTRRRIERRLSAYRADQWSSALDYLERFARAGVDGELVEGVLQEKAHLEEARLRARIQLDPFVNGASAQLVLDLVNAATERGWSPRVTVVETFADSAIIPNSLKRVLLDVFTAVQEGSCQITLYVDEDEECLTFLSSTLDLQHVATEINLKKWADQGLFDGQRISTNYESADGQKWLELRRRR
ncbi:MAG TPA: ATP-binding protein [Candidatus Nanopelagicaceae bacterium]|nr:ATP-binding protein [Candidatus Nanopelagicaceae bacterium]